MESKLFRLKRIKFQLWRFFPIFLLIIAIILIILSVTGNSFIARTKQKAITIFEPVISVISKPVQWAQNGIDYIKDWATTYQENNRLKEENLELLKWRSLALQLIEEQKELKEHLKYSPPPKTNNLLADIVLDEKSAFSRSFIVSAGEEEGVKKGMLAFSPKGLFARVVEVMPHHARVMALTDYMSRVPVWVGENKVSAILVGDNTASPYLQFLHEDETVNVGDIIMTSGYVGVYPAGLTIGYVNDIQEDEVRVVPFENGEKLFFVRLVDFELSQPLLKEVELQ